MPNNENTESVLEFFGINIEDIRGHKGDSPSEEYLLSLIKPLIPEPLKPSREELLALIKPLIPKVEDGHTPTKSELLSLITPLIPTTEELLELIEPLIPPPIPGKPGQDGKDADIKPLEENVEKLSELFNELRTDVKKGIYNKTTIGWGAHPIRIEDDGSLIDKNARTLNFTGGTITRSSDGKINVPLGTPAFIDAISDTATVNLDVTGTTLSATVLPAGVDHNSTANLTVGDVHTQYAFLGGRVSGQTLTGGTAASNNLVLRSTTNATKGFVYVDETTSSTSRSTGAMVIGNGTAGGLGVGGRIHTGGLTTHSTINAGANQSYNIGSSTVRFNQVHAGTPKFLNTNDLTAGSVTLSAATADPYFVYASGDVTGTSSLNANMSASNFNVMSLYTDSFGSANNTVTADNTALGGVFIGGVSSYAGASSTGHLVTSTTSGAGGSTLIGANYCHGGDGTTPSTTSMTSSGFASVVLGAVGVDNQVSGNGCTATLQNSSEGGLTVGSVAIANQTGHIATLEGTGTAAAYAFGRVSRGVGKARNRGAFLVASIDATSNTATADAVGLASFLVTRLAGTGSATVSGNASFGVINVTSTGSGSATGSGAASVTVVQLSSSGNATNSSSGGLLVGRAASTGSISVTTGAGNFAIGDAGTTGISATGSINCGQIGQGANSTASSVQFGATIMLDHGNGRVGIGQSSPTAKLHLGAGSTAASSAPIKLTSGTNMTTAEAGAIEFTTDDFFATITTGAARKAFVLDDGTRLTSGRVPFATTNGRLTDDADFTFATDTLTVTKIAATQFTGNTTWADGINMVFNTTTGTKLGTATTQKIGLWNATPIVQPTTAVAAATFVANTSGIVDDTATFDGYTIGQIVKALRNIGALA